MIEPYKFDAMISKVEVMTRPMNADETIRERMKDEYFERLKRVDYFLLTKAVDHLIETHKIRTFPLLAEFLVAINVVRHELPIVDEEIDCAYCRGTGAVIIDSADELGVTMKYNEAKPCTCAAGMRYSRNWRLYDSRRRRQKSKEVI